MLNFSLEYFPPSEELDLKDLLDQAKSMSQFSPLYMSITHSAKDGMFDNTFQTIDFMRDSLPTTLTPHMTCAPYSINEIMKIADSYDELGLDSVVALRGYSDQNLSDRDPYFDNSPDFIKALREKFNFHISISAYPEGHPEKINEKEDMQYLMKKCDSGADEILTQWFFLNDYFYEFRDKCSENGIEIPIVPGILPISDIDKVKHFANVCGSNIPKNIIDQFESINGETHAQEELGIEVAISQIEDLQKNGVENFHLYTLNRGRMSRYIIENFKKAQIDEDYREEKKAS